MAGRVILVPALALVALAVICSGRPLSARQDPALSVRITSPLGRTGLSGPIRIVAQVRQTTAAPHRVNFFVNQNLLKSVEQGPYAVEWVDANPFDRCEITVEVVDGSGNKATDRVVLEPFEILEAAEVSSVLVEASVQDARGRFVKGLPRDIFTVMEDGVPQALDLVSQEAVSATFALLIDSSNSMAPRLDFVHRTAANLASYLGPKDRMVIAPFSKRIDTVTGPTNDPLTIDEAIRAIKPSGGTAILDALMQTASSLESVEGRRVIVLVTDGYDEHSTASFDDVLAALKKAHATVYVVGIGGVAGISIRGERLLRKIATDTGGRFFFPYSDGQLRTVHDTLSEDVQNRYLITYTPANQRVDGTWRTIDVRTSDASLKVRARDGYFAPEPPPVRPNVEFTATDVEGRYIDLSSEMVEVTESGTPQRIESFQEAVQPVSIVLALDASGSMRQKEADVVESARRFVGVLRPEDSLAVVLFADRVEFAHDLSTNRSSSQTAIGSYKATGGTALYDVLVESLRRLKTVQGRRVVVVMTDGKDENNPGTAPGSTSTLADVLRAQEQTGATIYGIGLGTKVDGAPLQQLAAKSGGQALFPTDVRGLDAEYRRVAEDLRRRYVISYTSTNPQRDGHWREVQIRILNAPGATVRSAGGYFAPDR